MTELSLAKLTDYDISPDGRRVGLNFADEEGNPVSLKISAMELENVAHELGFVITKARQLSSISKQGIVPFLRPTKFRANLLKDGQAVVVSFQTATGLELHYGLDATSAAELASQLQEAAQKGMTATAPRPN
jgi:hypothetical protein